MKNAITSAARFFSAAIATILFATANPAQAAEAVVINLSYDLDRDAVEYMDELKAIEAHLANKFDLKFKWNGNTIKVTNDSGSVNGTIRISGKKLTANITLAPKLRLFSKVIRTGLDKEFRTKLNA